MHMLQKLFLLTFLCTTALCKRVKVEYIRHGQSEWNYRQGWCFVFNRGCQDAKLTKKGWVDAVKVQDAYDGKDPNKYIFLASPLRRAFMTLVTATKGMNWGQMQGPMDIQIRPEFREVGTRDACSKVLAEPGCKASQDPATPNDPGREKLRTLLTTYSSLQKTKDDFDGKDPTTFTATGQSSGDGIPVADRFNLIIDDQVFHKEWYKDTLQSKNRWSKIEPWARRIVQLFQTVASEAAEQDKTILIGGHSQIVFALSQMTKKGTDFAAEGVSWPWQMDSSSGKLANGAVLRFEVDSDTGKIVTTPKIDFEIRPSGAPSVCFEEKHNNCHIEAVCQRAVCTGKLNHASSKSSESFVSQTSGPNTFISPVSPFLVAFVGIFCFGFGYLVKKNHPKGDDYIAFLEFDEQASKI